MAFANVNGVTLHYEFLSEYDDEPVVVLVNSLGTDFRIWLPLIDELTDNWSVLVYDKRGVYDLLTRSAFLKDFREASAQATRGCVVLERPDIVRELVRKHAATDMTSRQTAFAELGTMTPRPSQHTPGNEVPEEHWAYRLAKRHWFFGFGAYT